MIGHALLERSATAQEGLRLIRMVCRGGAQTADGLHTIRDGRTAHAGEVRCGAAVLRGGARGALRRGSADGVVGQQELEGALLEADDAVADVLGVISRCRRGWRTASLFLLYRLSLA